MMVFRSSVLILMLSLAACSSSASTGLVLSGGGAKGAYEVGVWHALRKTGVASDISVISGTSVGAINGALFASVKNCRKIEKFWLDSVDSIIDVNYSKVAEVAGNVIETVTRQSDLVNSGKASAGEALVDGLLELGLKALDDFCSFTMTTNSYKGVLSTGGLRTALDKAIPADWDDSMPDVYVTAIAKGESIKQTYFLNRLDDSSRKDLLCASAAFPYVFSTVKVDGRENFDGGWEAQGGDNVPVQPVIDSGKNITAIIVVYLDDKYHIERRIDKARYPGIKIIEIIPSGDLGDIWSGTLNFDSEKAKENMRLGYRDAMKILSSLGFY